MLATVAAENGQCCGPGCRSSSTTAAQHYDETYFAWHYKIGEAKAKATNWALHYRIRKGETVLDFGAGAGAILRSMKARDGKLIAVEYNPAARSFIRKNRPAIQTYQYPEQVPVGTVDIVVSTSVIEHVECPIQELRALHTALRAGGRVVIGIKNEAMELWRGWNPNNIDNHLWTWNSMLLGNTLRAAGFVVDSIRSSGKSHADVEDTNKAKDFGRGGHTFQYLWLYGHKPTVGERWPQANTTRLAVGHHALQRKRGSGTAGGRGGGKRPEGAAVASPIGLLSRDWWRPTSWFTW
jgi:SAM-dependent methyltransferase